jgi:hypothetical protein
MTGGTPVLVFANTAAVVQRVLSITVTLGLSRSVPQKRHHARFFLVQQAL